jgi:GNAT superfamily N-acetyltransferase
MPIALSDLEIVDADHSVYDVSAFDCADADLNDFLKSDCLTYREQKLSHTKLALLENAIVGYIALATDSISLKTSELGWLIPYNVTIQHIPALKVGRLGISKAHQKLGIGKALMRYSVGIAFRLSTEGNVGCRFLTVDAYPESIGFYESIGFVRSEHKFYKGKKNPTMHYDIIGGKPL